MIKYYNIIIKNKHLPVFLSEIKNHLNILSNGIYIDCTFGAGNHSRLILSKLSYKGHLYSIDRDPLVLNKIIHYPYFKKNNFTFINGLISDIDIYGKKYNFLGKVNGIIIDLGISNEQLQDKNRGFSFNLNSKLDMRMNNTNGITAKQWINTATKKEIIQVLKNNSQEKFASRIANFILLNRKKKIISTTFDLRDIIFEAIKNKYYKNYHLHPATRTFQAIRMYINNELKELKLCLEKILSILKINGILIIISFHSGEAKIIKNIVNTYKHNINILSSNKYLLTYKCYNNIFYLKQIDKIIPSFKEKKKNICCKSAIMRIYKKKKFI